ncbi:hypothetical protein ACIQZN_01835 [Streptomyces sp. NPDC097595]|uniref:hypothetical protein n=1 Tax=Streptomyces sp. NPDC097595 TaxID=3366090 RepID=UPI00380FE8D0
MTPTEEVLQDLAQPSNVSVQSDDALVGKVKAAIATDDKKRKENEDEQLSPHIGHDLSNHVTYCEPSQGMRSQASSIPKIIGAAAGMPRLLLFTSFS